MTFSASTTPDITESIPLALTRAQKASQTYLQSGISFDVSIAGIPFLMPAKTASPYKRQSAQVQKQQVDVGHVAGEQTLDGYWIRSQTSWHMGAGTRYSEATLDPATDYRFEECQGVDPWTKGKLSLLHSTDNIATVTSGQTAHVTGAMVSGASVIFTNENGTIKRRGTATTVYTGLTDAVSKVVVAGAKILVGHSTAVAQGDATGSTLADLWTGAPSTPTPYWVKNRIIAVTGNQLWELTLAGGTWPTTPMYTHPDTNWKWTDVAQGPTAIYAAGNSNGVSTIFAFKLTDATSGNVPVLGQAYQVSELPQGEEIYAIHVALGAFMGIGTSRGIRVATILNNSIVGNGTLTIGPLIVNTSKPVRSICSGDRFLYAGVDSAHPDGNSGALRIDLAYEVPNNPLRYPYAWDARAGVTGPVASIAIYGNTTQVAMGITGQGIYLQNPTNYEQNAWIRTGRIRFGTVNTKLFRLLSVSEYTGIGTVGISSVDANGTELSIRTLSNGASGAMISLSSLLLAEHYRFKFTLNPDATLTQTPVIDSVQVRAVAAPQSRQRMIQIPLSAMDDEQSALGTRVGHDGWALERLLALEAAEENIVIVTVQDFTTGETYQGVIEQVDFTKQVPRSTDGRKNFGGFINVLIRKLT